MNRLDIISSLVGMKLVDLQGSLEARVDVMYGFCG